MQDYNFEHRRFINQKYLRNILTLAFQKLTKQLKIILI